MWRWRSSSAYDRLDGKGIDIVFDALPITGSVALRENEARWPEVQQQEVWSTRSGNID